MCCAQQVSSASLLLGALNHRSSEDRKHAGRGLTMLTPAVDIGSGLPDLHLKGSKQKKETIYIHRWKIFFMA